MTLANGTSSSQPDLIVVGGGLAGLTAAALVARAGRSVVVVEQASHLGGRAATQIRDGVHFNLGAHALYCRGQAHRVFSELGIAFSGKFPSPGRSLLSDRDVTYRLPQGPMSLFASRLLTVREKLRMAGLLAGFQRIDASAFSRTTVRDWVRQVTGSGNLARFMHALFRLSTYINDPDRLSAGVAIDGLQKALAGNVLYLDGGWQVLVEGLRAKTAAFGAQLRTGTRARAVRCSGESVIVQLASGETLSGRLAVLAVPPAVASELLDSPVDAPAARRLAGCIPVRAACLDIAMRGLSQPTVRFVLGLEPPLYYSVHSAAAKLAPEGIAVIHLLKYLGDDDSPAAVAEREMEAILNRVQPGWQNRLVARRYLPAMTVAHDLPRADAGGLSGRTAVAVPDRPGIFLAGDWVGTEGMLADAAAASAREASRQVLDALEHSGPRERSSAHAGK